MTQGTLFGGRDTLAEARERLHARLDEGSVCPCCVCPCCDQLARLRRYKLDSGIAYALTQFYVLGGPHHRDWVHYADVTRIAGNTMKFSLAKFWGLLERSGEKMLTGQRSPAGRKNSRGEWRLPDMGCAFVEGKITVPASILVYNDTCYGMSDEQVTIHQALGDKFDYDELMDHAEGGT